MITPGNMKNFTNNEVVEMYEKLNQDLTKTIINKLKKSGDISSFTRSQMRTLKRTGGTEIFKEALLKTNSLTNKRKKEVQKLFDEIGEQSLKGYKSTFENKGINYELSKDMVTLLKYASKVSNKTIKNLTKSIAYASKKKFIDAVDQVYKEVTTGAYDYNTSIKKAVRTLAKEGVTLKASDGRHEQLDVAVKRNLYTSIQQTTKSLAESIGKLIDYNCVVIGHSEKCRPSHHVIDAVVMSKDEFSKYEYLTEEYNCNHIVNYDWREEFDEGKEIEYTKEHESYDKTVRNYNKLQKANYYARQVRKSKRAIASGDKTDEAKKELKTSQIKYRTYCRSNGLPVDYDKTWTVGYNK